MVLISSSSVLMYLRAAVGSCSATDPCDTGCCSKEGYCGFGPKFCGDDVCQSNCDAVAECGEYAATPRATCPLNVCCSQFGFCGTTEDFCGTGCQSGCDKVNEPCSGTSSEAVYVGYYEGWNPTRSCDVVLPENINVKPWTHLYYSFAGIDSSDFTITTTHDSDREYWSKFTALKQKKSSLKTYISVGGWDLGGKVFSDMVRFPGGRKAFIDSAIAMMSEYGFDGIDIDWEYPAAEDRGGAARDTGNLVTFLSELKTAVGSDYGVTCTLPSSYWYLKGFDLAGMAKYVDFFNFMAYDIHGTWDGTSKWTSSVVNPHTNLTEISAGLDLLWRNNIDPSKVLLGLGFYGRSFTLADPSCNTPGCAFYTANNSTGGAVAGECTETSGFLSDYEISWIIDSYDVNVDYDATAGVNWIKWSGNQWASFDNGRTLKQKADFANGKCLGGLFSWALDLGGPGSLQNPNAMTSDDTSMEGASSDGGSDGTGLLYVGSPVLGASPTVTGVAPVSIIYPKHILPSPTVISPGGYPTSLELVWNTTRTVTSGSSTTVSTGPTRLIVPTTIPIPPITTSTIFYHNWNITDSKVTSTVGMLIPSVELPPVIVTDDPNPLKETGVTHSPLGTRTVTIPPWPWWTTGTTYPSITFTQGDPAGPTCTANCGHKCYSFCSGPCLTDCGPESSASFIDPLDPDAPSVSKCSGPGCVNGQCKGSGLCIQRGCTGKDCQSRVCVGEDCIPTACVGSDCTDGHCTGKSCQDHGCIGSDCNENHKSDDDSGSDDDDDNDDDDDSDGGGGGGSKGRCFGLSCLSWGCMGQDCSAAHHTCSGHACRVVSCSGPGCQNGICQGKGCQSEDSDCESETADRCTEYISSTLVTPASTYSTTTVTSRCETITACSAKPTTVTSTVDKDGLMEGTITLIDYYTTDGEAAMTAAWDEMDSFYSIAFATITTTTTRPTTTTTTQSTKTTSTASAPTETDYNCKGSPRCGTFAHLRSFCDMAKSFLGSNTYGTKDTDSDSGTCYTDGKNAGFGCGVFLEGDDCEMAGPEMAAAYDHIFQESGGDCKICGHAFFPGGCQLTVNYVHGCKTTNGPLRAYVGNETSSELAS
ncbi:bacteriodes thetaiotaomicron symbiotic chitinase [Aspergillus homomorphus CBS 101889]|uniref:chitinase n=1 Tax=Aspergillus homomorphus (strain CBS 101889) TaxID=1450537 RepID=A0A395I3B1_ASPHC|nr:bacteriodes thetaiotaomicron symbiotic chitinase [Aspergillus homomorphus CBS 101889]RAL14681.1 bacteriodes thetaiotaomicron symbiotic chitinase [Aspergillus homomorphus CBS 101889]